MYIYLFWIVVGAAFAGWLAVVMHSNKARERYKPVIYVCHVNDYVGFVLRRDYDRASKEHWDHYRNGEWGEHDPGNIAVTSGKRLEVTPIFIFPYPEDRRPSLMFPDCFVERAEFEVPYPLDDQFDSIEEAVAYFHTGKLLQNQK